MYIHRHTKILTTTIIAKIQKKVNINQMKRKITIYVLNCYTAVKLTEATHIHIQFSSVAQLCPTLQPHELQHARPPCPSPTPGVYPN